MNPTNVEAEREAPMTTFASGAGCFHHPFSNPERAKRLIFVAFAETFPDLSCSAHGAFLVYDSPKRMGKCGSWMSKQLFKKEQSSTQFHTKTRIRKISTFSGWWLYTHPVLKNDGVRQLRDDDRNPIFLGKCQIHGNQLPPTSWILLVLSFVDLCWRHWRQGSLTTGTRPRFPRGLSSKKCEETRCQSV